AYTPAEIRYFLGDAEPAVFVCGPKQIDQMTKLGRELGVPHVETLGSDGRGTLTDKAAKASPDFTDIRRTGDDLAAILYTSGTTGRSKGAMLSHGNLASNAQSLRDIWRFTPDDRLLHALPIFHTHGLFVAINITLMTGSSLIFLPAFNADEIMRLLPKATVMMAVPTFYGRLLARPDFDRASVRHMRLFVSGSAPLSAETNEKQIQSAIASDLAKYKQPKRVFVTTDIPRNAMGKIQKKDLRELYRGTFGGPQARP